MSDRRCSVEGCERPRYARGWCQAHYRRWLIYGGVSPEVPIRPDAALSYDAPIAAGGAQHYAA